jgi:hypothetical protein
MQKRRYSQEQVQRLLTQLAQYQAYTSPFNKQSGGPSFSPRVWWQTLPATLGTDMIQQLALLLLDVVPHSAATERTFSVTGFYHSKTRNRMTVGTTGKLAAIKLHYLAQRPAPPPERKRAADQKRKKARVQQTVDLTEAAAARDEVQVLEPAPVELAEEEDEVLEDEDIEELIGAFDEVYQRDKEVEAAGAAFDGYAVHVLRNRLLGIWPGVDLSDEQWYTDEAVEQPQQRVDGSLGSNTEEFDIDSLVDAACG